MDARRLEAAHRVAPIAGIGTTDHGAHDGSVVIVAGADDAAGAALVMLLLHCSELHSFNHYNDTGGTDTRWAPPCQPSTCREALEWMVVVHR